MKVRLETAEAIYPNDWATRAILDAVGSEIRILNIGYLERGRFHGIAVANTDQGAVIVIKSTFGEPRVRHVPLPGKRFAFRCVRCEGAMDVVDPKAPRDLWCSHCGKAYQLNEQNGVFMLVTDGQVSLPEEPALRSQYQPMAIQPSTAPRKRPARKRAAKKKRTARKKAVKKRARKAKTKATKKKTAKKARKKRAARPRYYAYNDYRLYKRETTLKGGKKQNIYFFAKKEPRSGTRTALPKGYRVVVTARTGLPVLRRVAKGTGTATTKEIEFAQKKKRYRPQCLALTPDGKQCRNSARSGSKYCASHKSYHPPEQAGVPGQSDTLPRTKGAKDTAPSYRHSKRRRRKPSKKAKAAKKTPKRSQKAKRKATKRKPARKRATKRKRKAAKRKATRRKATRRKR